MNGKTEALIRLTGKIKLIKSPRPITQEPNEKLAGLAVFNVTDGMVSKFHLEVTAEFEAGELVVTRFLKSTTPASRAKPSS